MKDDKLKIFIEENMEAFNDEAPPSSLWDRVNAAISGNEDRVNDPLREFIATHREVFDNETPPPRVKAWLFPANLGVTHRRKRFGYLLGIAASLLLLFAAYQFGSTAGYRAGHDEHLARQLDRIDPELGEATRFYEQKISVEYNKVTRVNDDPQLRLDLAEIDAATNDIRKQLLTVPVSQRQVLVNELIGAYRTKLDILLRIQQHFSPPTTPGGLPSNRPNNKNHES